MVRIIYQGEKPPALVTIADSERVVWSGTYRAFQADNIDALSVSELCLLWDTGELEVGGGAAPAFSIRLSREGLQDMQNCVAQS